MLQHIRNFVKDFIKYHNILFFYINDFNYVITLFNNKNFIILKGIKKTLSIINKKNVNSIFYSFFKLFQKK